MGRSASSREQAACATWRSRAGVHGSDRARSPSCVRPRWIAADSTVAAMTFSSLPQSRQCTWTARQPPAANAG